MSYTAATAAETPAPRHSTFKDRIGREWRVELTAALVDKVMADANFDLDAFADSPDAFAGTVSDPRVAGMLLWVLCEEQALADCIDPAAFARRFDGDAVVRAFDALAAELVAYYRRAAVANPVVGKLPEILGPVPDLEA